jgi:hypothetical protein
VVGYWAVVDAFLGSGGADLGEQGRSADLLTANNYISPLFINWSGGVYE